MIGFCWHSPTSVVLGFYSHHHYHHRSLRYCPISSSYSSSCQSPSSSCSSSCLHASSIPLIIIDVENVRGKSAFQWSHEALIVACTLWRNQYYPHHHQHSSSSSAAAALALVIDHGCHRSILTGGPLESGVGIFFAGDEYNMKADDIIVDIVQQQQRPQQPTAADFTTTATRSSSESSPTEKTTAATTSPRHRTTTKHRNVVTLVTADTELIRRCQYAASAKNQQYHATFTRTPTAVFGLSSKQHHDYDASNNDDDDDNDDIDGDNDHNNHNNIRTICQLSILDPKKFLDQLDRIMTTMQRQQSFQGPSSSPSLLPLSLFDQNDHSLDQQPHHFYSSDLNGQSAQIIVNNDNNKNENEDTTVIGADGDYSTTHVANNMIHEMTWNSLLTTRLSENNIETTTSSTCLSAAAASASSSTSTAATTDVLLQQASTKQELLSLYQMLNPRGKRGKKRSGMMARNKRIKLQARLQKTRHRLAQVLQLRPTITINTTTTTTMPSDHNNKQHHGLESLQDYPNNSNPESAIPIEYDLDQVAEELIARKRLFATTSAESTWERQVLSQRLHRRLLQAGTVTSNNMTLIFQNLQQQQQQQQQSVTEDTVTRVIDKTNSIVNNVLMDQQEQHLDHSMLTIVPEPSPVLLSRAPVLPPPQSASLQVLTVPRVAERDDKSPTNQPTERQQAILPPLRIIAISDTHGYEDQLSFFLPPRPEHSNGGDGNGAALDNTPSASSSLSAPPPYFLFPDADVLIHCGDFYGQGHRSNKKVCMKHLDALLAAQSHIPTKIVIRGNHDPMSPSKALFPRSGALYATKPMTLTVKGTTIMLVPFSRRTAANFQIPRCDVLVSHEPPFGILDRTYQERHAGSVILRRAVERPKYKPPLWLCGHIHEGRGSKVHTFHKTRLPSATFGGESTVVSEDQDALTSTVVVNVANANCGRANRLVAGPFVISLGEESSLSHNQATTSSSSTPFHPMLASQEETTKPSRLMRPDALSLLLRRDETFCNDDDHRGDQSNRLIAVDLGLRTATAVFDSEGNFVSKEEFHFKDAAALEKAIPNLILSSNITHVVVEGEDVTLYDVWSRSVESLRHNASVLADTDRHKLTKLQLARITADEWRRELLLPKQLKSSRLAKVAAAKIAHQVAGGESMAGKLTTDAAEAILAGHYATRFLGWSDRDGPAVFRYSNGDVARHGW